MDRPNRKRNLRREAALETIRYVEGVRQEMWHVMEDEVKNEEDKARLIHFSRGMNFVLRVLREKV